MLNKYQVIFSPIKSCLSAQQSPVQSQHAPHKWSTEFKHSMFNLQFEQSDADESIFISADRSIILAIYVDDILILAPTTQQIDNTASHLQFFFTLHALSPLKYFLSMDITHKDTLGEINISQ